MDKIDELIHWLFKKICNFQNADDRHAELIKLLKSKNCTPDDIDELERRLTQPPHCTNLGDLLLDIEKIKSELLI